MGDVLDVGCGTGENALHLASLGRRVVGIDAAPTAVARAREKAAERGLPAAFLVADALDLAKLRRRFETVIDCGLFHTFEPEQRRPYAHSLCEVLSSGGTLHVLCFSDAEPPGPGPRRIAEHELGDAFRGIFVTTRIRPGRLREHAPPRRREGVGRDADADLRSVLRLGLGLKQSRSRSTSRSGSRSTIRTG